MFIMHLFLRLAATGGVPVPPHSCPDQTSESNCGCGLSVARVFLCIRIDFLYVYLLPFQIINQRSSLSFPRTSHSAGTSRQRECSSPRVTGSCMSAAGVFSVEASIANLVVFFLFSLSVSPLCPSRNSPRPFFLSEFWWVGPELGVSWLVGEGGILEGPRVSSVYFVLVFGF